MSYTKDQIQLGLNALTSNMSLFYKSGCVNYRGKTADTKEYYTEVIASWLLERPALFDQIKPISRKSSYRVDGHSGYPIHPDSNREEELIAMAIMRQGSLPSSGQILDYQTPLKNTQKDKAGKIDLLSYDGTTLRILELKKPDSKETMLRCILEAYTYLRTVDQTKLLANFSLPANTIVQASPLVFLGGYQWKEMKQQGHINLKKLMIALNTKPYYIWENLDTYCVMEGEIDG